MSDGAEDRSNRDSRVVEDVLDEVLSFNYRSLRTFRDIFLRPGHIAACFIAGDRDSYTPTMRVWFGVLSWMFLLSIVWGGFTAIMFRTPPEAQDALSQMLGELGRDIPTVLSTFDTYAAIIYVPLNAMFVIPGYVLVRAFRPELSRIQAVQCYFIPVTALLTASIFSLLISSQEPGLFSMAPVFNYLIFTVTAWRVIRPNLAKSAGQAITRTALLALLVFVLSTLGTLISVVSAFSLAVATTPPLGG